MAITKLEDLELAGNEECRAIWASSPMGFDELLRAGYFRSCSKILAPQSFSDMEDAEDSSAPEYQPWATADGTGKPPVPTWKGIPIDQYPQGSMQYDPINRGWVPVTPHYAPGGEVPFNPQQPSGSGLSTPANGDIVPENSWDLGIVGEFNLDPPNFTGELIDGLGAFAPQRWYE